MSWSHRFENIRQRDWADIINYWAEFGNGFNTAGFLDNSLEDALEPLLHPGDLNGNDVRYTIFEQRVSFLSELIFTQVKANHALASALGRLDGGDASWGIADAYHATMQLMKSILAAFGIFCCQVHNRNVVIDAFPWVGKKDDQKKFKKKYSNWKQAAAVITCTSREFSQSDLFGLFQRTLNISAVPPQLWPEVVVRNIINTPKANFSAPRNKIIYGSRFWPNEADLLAECLSLKWASVPKKDILNYQFTKLEDANEIDSYCDCWVLYGLSRRLHESIYQSFSDSIGVFDYMRVRGGRFRILESQFSNGL